MKRYLKVIYLPLAVLATGLLAFLMRLWLLGAKDEHGLLPTGSFPDVMSLILVALTMALLFWGTRQLRGGNKYAYNFSASMPAAASMALAALGFVITSIADFGASVDGIGAFSAFLGFLAAIALLMLAYARSKGQRLNVIFHGIVCFYLILHLVSHYRLWSSFPQLQSYGFELLAIVFVMLASYQRAAFDAGSGNRQGYTFFSLAALFFCIAALPGCDNAAFFLGSAVWMFCTPCKLSILVKKEN